MRKRLFDLTAGLLGAGLFLPAGLLIGGLIALTSPGGPLLLQRRAGTAGRPFPVIKFRSMTADGRRVTGIGRWLRATAFDELPQLLNILRGEMSFVGPRPLLVAEADAVAAQPGGRERASVRPGLAGLAQLVGGKHPDPAARLALDVAYARRATLGLDLRILCGAVITSLARRWEPA